MVNAKKYIRSISSSKKINPQIMPLLNLKTAITHLGFFVDLSKAFDIENYAILLIKFENYGIKGTSLSLFKRGKAALANRKQYIQITNNSQKDV